MLLIPLLGETMELHYILINRGYIFPRIVVAIVNPIPKARTVLFGQQDVPIVLSKA
jgi:hypothetical protein